MIGSKNLKLKIHNVYTCTTTWGLWEAEVNFNTSYEERRNRTREVTTSWLRVTYARRKWYIGGDGENDKVCETLTLLGTIRVLSDANKPTSVTIKSEGTNFEQIESRRTRELASYCGWEECTFDNRVLYKGAADKGSLNYRSLIISWKLSEK
jgi:hypothetical protein